MKLLLGLHLLERWLRLSLGTLLLIALGVGLTGPVAGQDAATNTPAVYASQDPDRVRTALEEAVVHLRRLARNDPAGYYCNPVRHQKLIDWKEYELRYSEKEIDYPVYEAYKTKAMVATGGDSFGVERRLMEITRHRQVGTKKVKTLVQDPNGSEIRKVKLPVYGPGGPDALFSGFYGQNALAIYAQLLCGVPAEEEEFARSWVRLLNCIEAYGMPDRTWDLAWLTVAAVNLPQDSPARTNTVQRLINKLLLGQVPKGPGAGLWGPYCLHTSLLSKMIQYQQDFIKRELASWEDRLRLKPDNDHLKRKVNEAKSQLRKFQAQFADVTTTGASFGQGTTARPDQMFQMKVGWSFPDATISGPPYNVYGERTADIDSTALALFALEEAARARCLPETTVVPQSIEGQSFIPVEKTSTIIRRALEALMREQTKERPFSEGAHWQPVHDFDWVGLPDLPVKDQAFPAIDSPVTLLSAARTYAALHRASLLADSATAGGNLGAVLARARNVVTSAAKGYLEGGTNLPPLGGLRLPQEFAIELDPLLTKPGDPQQTNYELWLQMADKLLQQQRKNGSWGRLRRTDYPYYSHVDGLKEDGYAASLLARARIKAERHYEAEQAKLPPAKRKPYDPEANLWRSAPVYGAHHALRLQASVVATAYAMIALAQGVRPPILGVWTWDDQPPRSPVPRAVINALSKDKHIPFTYRLLSPDLPLEAIREVPVVYFGVSSPFAPTTAAALPNLEYYLRNRGLVVVEGAAGNDGQAILDQCQRKLLELAPDAQPGPLTPLVTGVNLQGLLVDSNQTVAVFYPVTADNPPAPGTIRLPDAARYTYQLLAQTAGPELLSPSYAIRWPLIEEAERKEAEEKARKEAEEAAKKAAKEAGVTPAEEAK